MAIITYLKGAVRTSIGADGTITKQAVWILIPDPIPSGITGWVAFEAEVSAWAGQVGDPYKKPVQDAGGMECTTYTADPTFAVSSVEYTAVEGRTHYEVTFSYTQNFDVLRPIGNVNVGVNNNNERTKTLSYMLTVTPGLAENPDPAAIDQHLFDSGTVIEWGDGLYLIDSSNYTAQSPSIYMITVNARDMSKMMVGNVTKSEDAFGQKTMSVTWRLALSVYYDTVIPEAGATVGDWFGAGITETDWVITSINETPDGVLGYTITLEAKHIAKRVMRVSQNSKWSMEDGLPVKSASIIYRTTAAQSVFDNELNRPGTAADSEGFVGQTITEVGIEQVGAADYEMTLSTEVDDAGSRLMVSSFAAATLEREVQINMTMAKYYFTAKDCGYFPIGGGIGYAPINQPPTATFIRTVTPSQLNASNPTYWTEAKILQCAKDFKLDEEPISKLIKVDGTEIVKKTDFASGTYAEIKEFKVVTYTYAQPPHIDKPTVTGAFFVAWNPEKHCPIWPVGVNSLSAWPKYPGTNLYQPYLYKYIGYGVPYMDCTVSMNYRGAVSSVVNDDWDDFYADAKAKIQNARFTSYKFKGLTVSGLRDNLGSEWTQVTVNLHALLMAKFNANYEEAPVINGDI